MESEKSSREKGIYKVTIVGSIVNFLLLVFKFFAGIAGHSAAMLADAVHSLSDFITDIVVIVFVRIAGKPEDKGHDYGHGKYETLATAIIGLLLLCVGFGIFWNGASSIYTFLRGGQLESPGVVALVAALVSIVSKEILYQYTVIQGKKLNSQAVIANAWHHRSDALSSIGTAIGIGGAILLGDHWRVLDPVAGRCGERDRADCTLFPGSEPAPPFAYPQNRQLLCHRIACPYGWEDNSGRGT